MDSIFWENLIDSAFDSVEKIGILNTIVLLLVIGMIYYFGILIRGQLEIINNQQKFISDLRSELFSYLNGQLDKSDSTDSVNEMPEKEKQKSNSGAKLLSLPFIPLIYIRAGYNVIIYILTLFFITNSIRKNIQKRNEIAKSYLQLVSKQIEIGYLIPFNCLIPEINLTRKWSSFASARLNYFDFFFIKGFELLNFEKKNHVKFEINNNLTFFAKTVKIDDNTFKWIGSLIDKDENLIEGYFDNDIYIPEEVEICVTKKILAENAPVWKAETVYNVPSNAVEELIINAFKNKTYFVTKHNIEVDDNSIYLLPLKSEVWNDIYSFKNNIKNKESDWPKKVNVGDSFFIKTHNNDFVQMVIIKISSDKVGFKFVRQLSGQRNFSIPFIEYPISEVPKANKANAADAKSRTAD